MTTLAKKMEQSSSAKWIGGGEYIIAALRVKSQSAWQEVKRIRLGECLGKVTGMGQNAGVHQSGRGKMMDGKIMEIGKCVARKWTARR
ncbi:MAG: hypothetical protein IAF94_15905 [Pirellulaceae bacterium]|nr:hypothetical protein [Pirellulaceae bacterium]